jgi:hypothetical protein
MRESLSGNDVLFSAAGVVLAPEQLHCETRTAVTQYRCGKRTPLHAHNSMICGLNAGTGTCVCCVIVRAGVSHVLGRVAHGRAWRALLDAEYLEVMNPDWVTNSMDFELESDVSACADGSM